MSTPSAGRKKAVCPGVCPGVGMHFQPGFLVQGIVLIGTAVVLRPVPLPAEAKAVVVAVCDVVGSFALGWVLVTRMRGLARVL